MAADAGAIAIAKAHLASACLRADTLSPALTRDGLAILYASLDAALEECSTANIQNCKTWIARNIADSKLRITALGQYLKALSQSLAPSKIGKPTKGSRASRTSNKRKRLHIIYVLTDVLHHTKQDGHGQSGTMLFADEIQPFLIDLFAYASSSDINRNKKTQAKLLNILKAWEAHDLFGRARLEELHSAVQSSVQRSGSKDGGQSTETIQNGDNVQGSSTIAKAPAFTLPKQHGDPFAPWYELPAGNMIPHLKRNPAAPISVRDMKPMQFRQGPVDGRLVHVLQDFFKDVRRIYRESGPEDEGIVADIDELGQPMIQDEASGTAVPVDNYYGWSISFCQAMKKSRTQTGNDAGGVGRGRSFSSSDRASRTRSRSFSRDSSPYKRRRRSSSISQRRYSRRSYSRSRSRSPARRRRRYNSRDSRSRSPDSRSSSRARSSSRNYRSLRSPDRRRSRSRSRSRSARQPSNQATDRSFGRQPPLPPPPPQNHPGFPSYNPAVSGFGQHPPPPPPPPPQGHNGQWHQNMPGNPPFPPFGTPPTGYNGPWPPPPPTIPFPGIPPPPPPPPNAPQHIGFQQQSGQYPSWENPPLQYQQNMQGQQMGYGGQKYGRGGWQQNNGYGHRGRGGRGRGW